MDGPEFLVPLLDINGPVYLALAWALNWSQSPRAYRFLSHLRRFHGAKKRQISPFPLSQFNQVLSWSSESKVHTFTAALYGQVGLLDITVASTDDPNEFPIYKWRWTWPVDKPLGLSSDPDRNNSFYWGPSYIVDTSQAIQLTALEFFKSLYAFMSLNNPQSQ